MEKIINIVFCPQDTEDTHAAINEARKLIDAGETVVLEPSANLIHTDALALLSTWGFKYSSSSKRFIK